MTYSGEGVPEGQLDPDRVYNESRDVLLGSGGSKMVYAVKGHPDLAVVHTNLEGYLHVHNMDLQYLVDIRVPAAVYRSIGPSGKNALVKRYPCASKGNGLDLANMRSVRDFIEISRTLRKANIRVDDFQVFVGHDGEMVVYDPLELVIFGRKEDPKQRGWYEDVLSRMANVWSRLEGGTSAERVQDLRKAISQ